MGRGRGGEGGAALKRLLHWLERKGGAMLGRRPFEEMSDFHPSHHPKSSQDRGPAAQPPPARSRPAEAAMSHPQRPKPNAHSLEASLHYI